MYAINTRSISVAFLAYFTVSTSSTCSSFWKCTSCGISILMFFTSRRKELATFFLFSLI
ncbi:hypothetical protein EVA_04766 [gut metagenome]|uniref:Uncharacterized protein n=1 Tax=gut metagenome TaxID=749906 RepID=J9H173_9ZZZZ